MNNIVENVIATLIVGAISAITGFLLIRGRKIYHGSKGRLMLWLVEKAFKANKTDVLLRQKILEQVLQEYPEINATGSIIVHPNQDACEAYIKDAFSKARKVKILTIRGQQYFLGARSLLYNMCLAKKDKGFSIEVLVLSPESGHITEDLAGELGHNSTERIRKDMRIARDNLCHMAEQNANFRVKWYDETPNFKILMFDDIMFVSSFAGGGPKNDRNAKMFQIARDNNPLFFGFERYFDDLAKRSISLP
jgi:hypothetical protein